jgi:hypothetical protein
MDAPPGAIRGGSRRGSYDEALDDADGLFVLETVGDPEDPSRPLPGDDPTIRAAMAEWLAALMAESKAEGESPA